MYGQLEIFAKNMDGVTKHSVHGASHSYGKALGDTGMLRRWALTGALKLPFHDFPDTLMAGDSFTFDFGGKGWFLTIDSRHWSEQGGDWRLTCSVSERELITLIDSAIAERDETTLQQVKPYT